MSSKPNNNKKIKIGDYIIKKEIDKGKYSKIYLAIHEPTKEKVTIKIINKSQLFSDEKDKSRVMNEISILKKVHHNNIIKLYEIIETETKIYIIMEYCDCGELFSYIVDSEYLPEEEACKYFQQIISSLSYLHSQNISHRDIKPENILLTSNKNEIKCKLIDFGISVTNNNLLETPCGTPMYVSPEMYLEKEYDGKISDIWSVGVLLYSMVFGFLPFCEEDQNKNKENIINGIYEIPEEASEELKDLIKHLLEIDTKKRYNCDDIRKHPWFKIVQPEYFRPGLIIGKNKIPIDENIVKKCVENGYDEKMVINSVKENKYDRNSAIYYLILNKDIKNGISSVSDLESKKFLDFIENKNNLIDNNDNNNASFRINYKKGNSCNKKEKQKINIKRFPINKEGVLIRTIIRNKISHLVKINTFDNENDVLSNYKKQIPNKDKSIHKHLSMFEHLRKPQNSVKIYSKKSHEVSVSDFMLDNHTLNNKTNKTNKTNIIDSKFLLGFISKNASINKDKNIEKNNSKKQILIIQNESHKNKAGFLYKKTKTLSASMNKKNKFSNFKNVRPKSLYIKKTIHYKNTYQNLHIINHLHDNINNYIQPYKKQNISQNKKRKFSPFLILSNRNSDKCNNIFVNKIIKQEQKPNIYLELSDRNSNGKIKSMLHEKIKTDNNSAVKNLSPFMNSVGNSYKPKKSQKTVIKEIDRILVINDSKSCYNYCDKKNKNCNGPIDLKNVIMANSLEIITKILQEVLNENKVKYKLIDGKYNCLKYSQKFNIEISDITNNEKDKNSKIFYYKMMKKNKFNGDIETIISNGIYNKFKKLYEEEIKKRNDE